MAEGRHDERGRWVSRLLDIQFVTPKRVPRRDVNSLANWREWAGAWTRAKPDRKPASLDDWFPPRVVNQPVGWEVTPGRAFYADPEFEDYLKAFMEMHNERQRNDQAAFERLLTEYIGANADGTLPAKQDRRTCLRVPFALAPNFVEERDDLLECLRRALFVPLVAIHNPEVTAAHQPDTVPTQRPHKPEAQERKRGIFSHHSSQALSRWID
jgi:hypothetical protein